MCGVCACRLSLFFNVLPPSSLQCINFYISEIRVAFVKIFVRAKNSLFYTLCKNINACVCAVCYTLVRFLVCAAHCCCVRVSWKYKTEWAGKIRQTSTHVEPSSSSNSGSIEILPTKTNLDPTTTTVAAAATTATDSTEHETKTTSTTISMGAIKKSIQNIKNPNAHTTSQPANQPCIHLNFRHTHNQNEPEKLWIVRAARNTNK